MLFRSVAGQSVVKLYAAAMFPGFFLSFMYLVYIVGWALLNPKIAPKLPESETKIPVRPWVAELAKSYSTKTVPMLMSALTSPARALAVTADGVRVSYLNLLQSAVYALVPLLIVVATMWGTWWYVVIHQAPDDALPSVVASDTQSRTATAVDDDQPPQELGGEQQQTTTQAEPEGLQEMGDPTLRESRTKEEYTGPDPRFYTYFWAICALLALMLVRYYWRMTVEQLEVVRLLTTSIMPLGILTVVVLAVILFGITTATESAGVGAAGAFILALQAGTFDWKRLKESIFLTAKTTAMVCWLFVGSALFSAVFALLGGQGLVERWVISLDMSPLQFMLLSQAIIFVLGWPLEWTEIIVIFCPIFLPLLKHFQIDPILWGTMVFVNLQAAFLSPPVAMSAFYLKGVSPPHVTLNQIFAGMMPYMLVVILCLAIMYVWPGLTLWLPEYLYSN